MRILVPDLSHVFWSVALGGQLQNPSAARDIAINQIRVLAKDYDRVAVAVDGKTKSFRAAHWPGYKAKRVERPDHLWSLLDDTVRHCAAAGWHVFRAPEHPSGDGSYEADDVVATVVAWCRENNHAVDILSGDSDLAQLVDDDLCVRLLRRYKGETKTLDADGVKAWLKVPPLMVAELKALAGDSGDGYGDLFRGVGEVKALKILEKYGTALDGVKAAVEAAAAGAKDAITNTLAAGGELRVQLGYFLARVCQDVPIDVGSLVHVREPEEIEEFGAELVDENAPPSEPAPAASSSSADAAPGPLMPRDVDSMVVSDPTMRMLAPAREAWNRLVEFRAFIKGCMIRNVDYGRIPKTDKDCLLKPGAEKLVEIYGLAPQFEIEKSIEEWGDAPLFFYRVRSRIVRKRDGMLIAECVGSCNSRETKYAGRWVKESQVPPHLDISRLKTREFVSDRGPDRGQRVVQYRVPNEEIFDHVNTILKMAQKRAMIGAVIIATRSGGVFTQDVDDLPDELRAPPAGAYGKAYAEKQWE